jgi:hypothetical protein
VIVHQFRHCTVRIWPERQYLEHVFEDGATVPATPEDNAAYRARAAANGYGADTWRQSLEHELSHTLIAEWLGHPYSRTLWRVAHAEPQPPETWGVEEAVVMAFQQFCCGIRGDNLDLLEMLGWDPRELERLRDRLRVLTADAA